MNKKWSTDKHTRLVEREGKGSGERDILKYFMVITLLCEIINS